MFYDDPITSLPREIEQRRISGLRGEYEDRPYTHDCRENTDSDNGTDWYCSVCGDPVADQDAEDPDPVRWPGGFDEPSYGGGS